MKREVTTIALLMLGALPVWGQMTTSHQSIFEQEAPKNQVTGRPVARVNGTTLTDRDLLREMYTIFPYARQHNGSFPKAMEADIRKGALKMIEFEELVYQEAKRRQLSIEPGRLDKAEQEFKTQFHTPDQFKEYMTAEAQGSRKVLREKIARSLLIEDILKTEVTEKSGVTLAQAKAYYEQHPEKFRLAESFVMQTISFMPGEKASSQQVADARKRADAALAQVKTTKDYESFGMLAEKISEDDYRVMMGDHRAVEVSKIPEQLLSVLKQMQPGQVSDVIQVEQTYTIVRLNAHNPLSLIHI